jgi:hypothetical protein
MARDVVVGKIAKGNKGAAGYEAGKSLSHREDLPSLFSRTRFLFLA